MWCIFTLCSVFASAQSFYYSQKNIFFFTFSDYLCKFSFLDHRNEEANCEFILFIFVHFIWTTRVEEAEKYELTFSHITEQLFPFLHSKQKKIPFIHAVPFLFCFDALMVSCLQEIVLISAKPDDDHCRHVKTIRKIVCLHIKYAP